MPDDIVYLGDGLYASFDGYQIRLMANSHEHPTDVVYLDPSVFKIFVEQGNRWFHLENKNAS